MNKRPDEGRPSDDETPEEDNQEEQEEHKKPSRNPREGNWRRKRTDRKHKRPREG